YWVCLFQVSVYKSLSHNPFENLAFEDWLYLNADLSNRRILFLWRNEPTIVIGRHQNPWFECSLKNLKQCSVHLARRKSGGGTVYHDLGNVNLSFFTPRHLYNRKENLALIVKVLRERWKLDVQASPRDDILADGKFKISGSSSKLGRLVAFHHCTLLLDADQELLKFLLQPSYAEINSKATQSVRSDVMNLSAKDPSITFENVTEEVALWFCHTYSPERDVKVVEIDPSKEELFPGITTMKEELQEWKWIYGKTPRFSVTFSTNLSSKDISITATSYHGLIEKIDIKCDDHEMLSLFTDLVSRLKGVQFEPGDIETALISYVNSSSFTALDRQICHHFIQWIVTVL
ncbi:unnamed protein product, partial [Porites lobata]